MKLFFISAVLLLLIACSDTDEASEIKIESDLSDTKPHLTFSDLISGPSTGLDDGEGSGVIITIWGQNLGVDQGNSILEICQTNCVPIEKIYYWKNADGQLPSGPADLFESHKMQEIAFSIPPISNGDSSIKLSTESGSSELPFIVRDGAIYHVKSDGNDSTGDGSFKNPWQTIARADAVANAGSTIYVHDVTTGDENQSQVIYNNRLEAMSELSAQFSYVAYPGFHPEAIGHRVFSSYAGEGVDVTGFVLSKFSLFSAEADENGNGQPVNVRSNSSYAILGSKNGRAIGNYITDAHPDDLSGACPDAEQAAITATGRGGDRISNFKVFGNQIEDYGCDGTSRFHHTTYFTVRSGDANLQLEAPEIGWNYLNNNRASSGLHYYDENHVSENCGQLTTPLVIHNNVIVDQSGPALYFGAKCPVDFDVVYYNNLAINVGLKADFDQLNLNSEVNNAVGIAAVHEGVNSKITFVHNTFFKWNEERKIKNTLSCIGLDGAFDNVSIVWEGNICLTGLDLPFIESSFLGVQLEDNIVGANNLWVNNGFIFSSEPPFWDSSPITENPGLIVNKPQISVPLNSSISQKVANSPILLDLYGIERGQLSTVGAVEASDN